MMAKIYLCVCVLFLVFLVTFVFWCPKMENKPIYTEILQKYHSEQRNHHTNDRSGNNSQKLDVTQTSTSYPTQTLKSEVATYLNLQGDVFDENKLSKDANWAQFYDRTRNGEPSFKYLIVQDSLCINITPFLVIMVATQPSEVTTRDIIRETWGSRRNWHGKYVLILFLIGKSKEPIEQLLSENDKHKDLIVQDFEDTYENLTLKTRMAFQWMYDFCLKAEFFMKTDSDVYVSPSNLVKYLLSLNENLSQNLFTGHIFENSTPFRSKSAKNYLSYEDYPINFFPPYCSGLGYVISGKLALKIFMIMHHVKPWANEDVYTGFCLKLLGGQPSSPPQNSFFFKQTNLNDKLQTLIAAHWVDQNAMKQLWEIEKASL
ncbi:UDP-GalNAc:beta-1,3-N-acetylgalactosaminyltransferase 1-like [Erpetoichthys calabaricus]|uniref:UDP-GalNAc:beta-1, 3-N-acetylgalactosaminyltransferase 1-like n=1 Tax=Erpetoichthys calabaricus TaxID=27687 RepID=UPI002234B521|nr:UDP-GalNAc:beta-1,3-N-acetylgalactosaminyltransferase 1-like [Erpetoichthys calabaricus]